MSEREKLTNVLSCCNTALLIQEVYCAVLPVNVVMAGYFILTKFSVVGLGIYGVVQISFGLEITI